MKPPRSKLRGITGRALSVRHHGFSRSSLYKVTSEQAPRNLPIEISLDFILYIYYHSSHYVCRYLAHHPWWQNVYAASAARVVSRQRQGPPPHTCQCQSLFRRGDRSDAIGAATQGGSGAPGDHPGLNHIAARGVFWCRVDRVPSRPTLGDSK